MNCWEYRERKIQFCIQEMKLRSIFFIITSLSVTLLIVFIVSCTKRDVLTISAAISLREPLLDIANQFNLIYPHSQLVFNFGSSGSLRHQIENGSPIDIFISAASKDMEILLKKDLVERNSYKSLLGNSLILITHKTNTTIKNFFDLNKPSVYKIAVGDFSSVPVGLYAKDTLLSLELLDKLHSKLVFAKNAIQAITYVETKNVQAGFVYKTDALMSKNIKIASNVDPSSHRPIKYYHAIIKNSPQSKIANTFLLFIEKQSSLKLFQDYGFRTIVPETSYLIK